MLPLVFLFYPCRLMNARQECFGANHIELETLDWKTFIPSYLFFFFFSSEKDPFLFAGLLPFGSVPNAVIEVESRRYQWNSSANTSALLPFSYISSDFYVEGIKRWGVGYFCFQDLPKQSLWKPSCLTLWEAVWEVNRSQLSFCFCSDFYCFFCSMEGLYQLFIVAISSVEL